MWCYGVPIASAQTGCIKKWTDADGNVHFGDVPPAEAGTRQVEAKPSSGSFNTSLWGLYFYMYGQTQ
ncbi:MAG: DUF4124 domain-containing protein [Candidatus Sedimenticola sp. (ex Thyasira tokunagai)]